MEKKDEHLDRLIDKAMDAAKVPESDFAFTQQVMDEIRLAEQSAVVRKPILSTKFKIGALAFAALIVMASFLNLPTSSVDFIQVVELPNWSVDLPSIHFPSIWLYGVTAFFLAFVACLMHFRRRVVN